MGGLEYEAVDRADAGALYDAGDDRVGGGSGRSAESGVAEGAGGSGRGERR